MNTIERDFCKKLSTLCDINQDRLLIAFSGGCDSLALLALSVKALGPEKVIPIYVNHNLRSPQELEEEMALNEANCRKIGVKLEICTIVRGDVGSLAKTRKGGVEEAARILRYQVLEQRRQAYKCTYIVTAHHRQDQLETIAMRLSNGSPVSSLCGISQKDKARHLIRPLLDFNRDDLEQYLKAQGFTWSEDSSNQDQSYARNMLRNKTLPSARELWPACDKNLLALSEAAKKLCQGRVEVGSSILIQDFKALNPTLKTLALFDLWNKVITDSEMPMTLVMRICQTVEKTAQEQSTQKISANGVDVTISKIGITMRKQETQNNEDYENFEVTFDPKQDQNIELLNGRMFLTGKNAEPYETEKSLRLDNSKFKGTPKIRFVKMGDSIQLKGGRKMVLKLLQDMKIPQNQRAKIPVLVDDEGLCAVFGSVAGGFDRICVKFRSSLAPNPFTLYIVN